MSRARKKAVAGRRREAKEVLRLVKIMRRQGANFPSVWMRGDGMISLEGKFVMPTIVEQLLAKVA